MNKPLKKQVQFHSEANLKKNRRMENKDFQCLESQILWVT